MGTQSTLIILDILLTGLERRGEIQRKLREVKDFLISKDGEDPTDEEWRELRERLRLAEDVIERRAKEARELLGES